MTLVRYIPISLEGGKIVYNKDLELLESSLEYEETFEEKFGTKSCNEWKDLKVKQKSNQEDTCENRREQSLNELKHIWSEVSDMDSFPVTSTPVIDKFDSALKSVTDSCPASIFPRTLETNFGPLTLECQLWTTNFGLPTLDCQLWTANFGLSTMAVTHGTPRLTFAS